MPELRVKKYRTVGKVAINGAPISIGRSSRNDIVLPSRMVSRKHAAIEVIDGSARIRDLGSSYGTHINGRPVKESPLFDGDVIRVGRFELTFSDPGGVKRPTTSPPLAPASRIETERDAADLLPSIEVDEETVASLEARSRETQALQLRLDERERELESRERKLADDRSALDAREADLAQHRAQLEAERASFAQHQQALEHRLGEMESAQQRLENARETLQSEVDRLLAENASLMEGGAEVAAARDAVQGELDALRQAHASLEASLVEAQSQRDAASARGETLAAELRTHAQSIESLQEEVQAAQIERRRLESRIAELESELESRRQEAERAQRDLQKTNRELRRKVDELELVSDAADTMEHQLHETQVMQAIAHERSNVAVRALQQFESGSQDLRQTSRRLSRILQVIEQLEEQWVECDEHMADVEQMGPPAIDAAIAERDQLAGQLEQAHAARDAAVADLLKLTDRIGALEVVVPEAPAAAMLDAGVSVKSWRKQRSRRAWWPF